MYDQRQVLTIDASVMMMIIIFVYVLASVYRTWHNHKCIQAFRLSLYTVKRKMNKKSQIHRLILSYCFILKHVLEIKNNHKQEKQKWK